MARYLIKARTHPADTLLEISERYGGVVRFPMGTRPIFLVTSSDGVGHILQENQHNYRGFQYSHHQFKPLLGNGLLTSDGETWRRHRQLAQQAFHPKQIQKLSIPMANAIQKFLTRWEGLSGPDFILDIGAEFTLLTLSIVTTSLFGNDIGEQAEIVKGSVPIVLHYLVDRMINPFTLPEWLPMRKNLEYRQALNSLNHIVQQIISNDRTGDEGQMNLLRMLMAARDHDGEDRLSEQELRDEIMTIFMAGHETCANALTWTFYCLARYPEIQDRLAEEVQRVLQGRLPSYEEIHQLPFTNMVFNETLRLYPPAWVMARDVLSQDIIDGFPIPAGSLVILSPFVNHRRSTFWENPSHFDPDRFAPARFNKLPRYAFFPFGGGQRLCLGKNFALLEALLVISLMIQRYKFLLPDRNPEYRPRTGDLSPDIVMQPRTPILLKLESR